MNTKQQGAIYVAKAIAYFAYEGYNISVPISDVQRYDLIVEKNGTLSRVEVKSSRFQSNNISYQVSLRTRGGNRSWTGKTVSLSSTDCELVFIGCDDGSQYLFPITLLEGRATINLPGKYKEYQV